MEQWLRAPVPQSSPSIAEMEKLYFGLMGFGAFATSAAVAASEMVAALQLLSADTTDSAEGEVQSSLWEELRGDGMPAEEHVVEAAKCGDGAPSSCGNI